MNNYPDNYEQGWSIKSECDNIHVISEIFQTQSCCAHMKIAEVKYTGNDAINTVIDSSSFVAVFSSDGIETLSEFVIHWSCYVYNQTGSEGILWLGEYGNNEEIIWNINSECSSIHLQSTHFDTERGWDILVIANQEYSGSDAINTIIDGPLFVATFISDFGSTATGFTILWSCFLS